MDVLSDAITAMRLGRPHSSRTVLRAPWGVRFQPQEGAGFHVILQGSCWLIPVTGEPVALGVGDVAFLPRELGHAIADAPTTPLTWARSPLAPLQEGPPPSDGPRTEMLCGAYLLDQSRAHPLLAGLPDVVHLPARIGRHPSLRGAIELLGQELDGGPRPGGDAAVLALLDVLLLYILRAWYDDRPGEVATGWGAALRDPAVLAALHGIHERPERPWTVQSLAGRSGLSRAAFARRFSELTGSAPMAYLTWWRMTIAARLLRDTDLTVRSVAAQVGYTSEFAFARAFKRELGTAPGHYRDTTDANPG
ncbi:AraC family transcriptional regulator [Nonomuraea antimicrobica]|uniref:AraC family transcriptional regulator n=1 Tax=Nonomuraea antimicrobica TaxID=561173 RepID=A0ABP7BBL8_9ACTN